MIDEKKAMEVVWGIKKARDEAYEKAIDSLSRYKFEMFGYWSSSWVKYNQLLPSPMKSGNPFQEFVKLARKKIPD